MSHIDSPPKESFGPVIASLDHPLSASRKEGIVFFVLLLPLSRLRKRGTSSVAHSG